MKPRDAPPEPPRRPSLASKTAQEAERGTIPHDNSGDTPGGTLDPAWVARQVPQPCPSRPQHVIVRDGFLAILSNGLYRNLQRAVAQGSFTENVDGWPSHRISGKDIAAIAQLRPDPRQPLADDVLEEVQQRMWELAKGLGDLDVDVLDAVIAIWLEHAGHPDEPVAVRADDVLRLRGVKAHMGGEGRRGGYTHVQRAQVGDAVERLAALRIRVLSAPVYRERPGRSGYPKRVRETWAVESSVLVVSSRLVKESDGSKNTYAWRIRPGDFLAPYLMGPGRQTALLSQKALAFDPYRQTWEKRLARYFAYQWRVGKKHGNEAREFRVKTLLLECDGNPDWSRPGRLKERLERALDALEGHGVIAGWVYAKTPAATTYQDPASGEELPGNDLRRTKGWLQGWLTWTVLVEPPRHVVEHYAPAPVGYAGNVSHPQLSPARSPRRRRPSVQSHQHHGHVATSSGKGRDRP